MALGNLQSEAPFLFDGVLDGLDVVCPGETVAFKSVVDGVIRCYGEGNAVGGFRAREGETAAGGSGVDGIKVEINVAVEIVDVHSAVAIKFWNFEVSMRAEQVLKGLVEGIQQRKQLSW